MTLATESITQAGSGLVFINRYGASVTDAYRNAVVTAEHQLQGLITDPVTISADFELHALGSTFAAQNSFSEVYVSYAALTNALRSHATTLNDGLAVNGLPASDPSNGAGFGVPLGQAVGLGLTAQTNAINLTVTLNSDMAWSYGQDVAGALEHEITEGAFGRIASLGLQGDNHWAPLDLFRFTAAGQRDYTGGGDGQTAYFGVDGAHVSALAYHNSISLAGVDDGFDLGDWNATVGDAFGPGAAGIAGVISPTDAQVMDVLGWSSATYTPPADDYADSLGDKTHPLGQLAVGGSATGALQSAGDRDWFAVGLHGGDTYRVDLAGHASGAGTLADPYLRLHDAGGALVASNDDVGGGGDPDSEIIFTAPTTGTYYVEAGGFADGYTGSYRVSVGQTVSQAATATTGNDVLTAAGGDSIDGLAGDDTLSGSGGHVLLFGGDGDDSILGGAGFDQVNGNKGDDTIIGRSASGDWLLGGQGNDLIDATASTGHNIVNGNLGDDTLHGGAGGDILRGGQGDDLIVGGAGADWLSGDKGHDTLTGAGGADVFHMSPGAGVSVVTDFDFADGDRVLLDPGSHYTISQSGADAVVDLGGGTQVILQNVDAHSLPPGAILLG